MIGLTERRWSLVGFALVVALTAAACGSDSDSTDSDSTESDGQESDRTLVVAGWGGSFTEANQEAFYEPFEEETGIDVVIATPGGGFAAKVEAQVSAGNIEWDLLEAPGGDTAKLMIDGNLEPFPESLVESLIPEVREGALRPNDDEPYYLAHGGTVNLVGCNPTLVDKCPTTPEEFFDVESFPGTRAITANNPVFTTVFALAGDGVEPDDYFPVDIPRAMETLQEIKPDISVWATSPAQMQQAVVDGEVAIMQAPNTVLISAKEQVPELELYWEDGLLFDEGWCVVKGAENQDEAFEFIQWYADNQENQAQFIEVLGSDTAGNDVTQYLPEDILENLPVNKAGVTLVDGVAGAEQQSELGEALREVLVD